MYSIGNKYLHEYIVKSINEEEGDYVHSKNIGISRIFSHMIVNSKLYNEETYKLMEEVVKVCYQYRGLDEDGDYDDFRIKILIEPTLLTDAVSSISFVVNRQYLHEV